jgi:hypothetical protein
MKTKTANVASTDIELNGQNSERTYTFKPFKYLGSVITSQNETEYDVNDQIAAANRCLRALNKMFSKIYISTKMRTYCHVLE